MNAWWAVAVVGAAALVVGTMDYAHDIEMEALRKEIRPQVAARLMRIEPGPIYMPKCKDGWLAKKLDNGRWVGVCVNARQEGTR